MTFWLDAHLPPSLEQCVRGHGYECHHVSSLGLRDAEDSEIYFKGRNASAVIITKDADFASLVSRVGPPPSVVWLRCGNTSRAALTALFDQKLQYVVSLLEQGTALIEIR